MNSEKRFDNLSAFIKVMLPLSWNYPMPVAIIAEAPNGTFSKQEEREAIEILSTFKENREDFAD